MWTKIHAIADTLWPLLPPITIGVRLLTALIGLASALRALTRRVRRRRNQS